MKNEAYLDGQRSAQQLLRESVIITTREWWEKQMEEYACGHWEDKQARGHFCQGWQSVSVSFAAQDTVKLTVYLMNFYPTAEREYSPLEKQMRQAFYGSMCKTRFLEETKAVRKYEVSGSVGALNQRAIVRFLRQKYVNFKVLEEAVQAGAEG